jgi:peptidoglycan/LPS O-acetylase OafA/YrhL
MRFLMIAGGVAGIGLTGHSAAPWGDGLPWRGTLVSYPIVAVCATAIVLGAIGIEFRLRPLEYLGKISYGLYVYHQMCIWITYRFLHVGSGVIHACLREGVSLVLTIAISAVSYALLEEPFLSLKQKFTYIHSRPV